MKYQYPTLGKYRRTLPYITEVKYEYWKSEARHVIIDHVSKLATREGNIMQKQRQGM